MRVYDIVRHCVLGRQSTPFSSGIVIIFAYIFLTFLGIVFWGGEMSMWCFPGWFISVFYTGTGILDGIRIIFNNMDGRDIPPPKINKTNKTEPKPGGGSTELFFVEAIMMVCFHILTTWFVICALCLPSGVLSAHACPRASFQPERPSKTYPTLVGNREIYTTTAAAYFSRF